MAICSRCRKAIPEDQRLIHLASHTTRPLDRLLRIKDHTRCIACKRNKHAPNHRLCQHCLSDFEDPDD